MLSFSFYLPHSFDSVPLPITKGAVDSDVSGAAAQVITESVSKQIESFLSVRQGALGSHVYGSTQINPARAHTEDFINITMNNYYSTSC